MKKLLKIFRIAEELKWADPGYRHWCKEIFFSLEVSDKIEKSECILSALASHQLGHLSQDLKKLEKDDLLEFVFDDGYLLISFPIGDLDVKKIGDKLDVIIL